MSAQFLIHVSYLWSSTKWCSKALLPQCNILFSFLEYFSLIYRLCDETKDAITGKQVGNCYGIRQSPIILLHVIGGEEPFVRVVRILLRHSVQFDLHLYRGGLFSENKSSRVVTHKSSSQSCFEIENVWKFMHKTMRSRWRMQHFRAMLTSKEIFLYIIFLHLKSSSSFCLIHCITNSGNVRKEYICNWFHILH